MLLAIASYVDIIIGHGRADTGLGKHEWAIITG